MEIWCFVPHFQFPYGWETGHNLSIQWIIPVKTWRHSVKNVLTLKLHANLIRCWPHVVLRAGTNNRVIFMWVSFSGNEGMKASPSSGESTSFYSTHVVSEGQHQDSNRTIREREGDGIWIHSRVINKLLIKAKQSNGVRLFAWILCRHGRWSRLETSFGILRKICLIKIWGITATLALVYLWSRDLWSGITASHRESVWSSGEGRNKSLKRWRERELLAVQIIKTDSEATRWLQ